MDWLVPTACAVGCILPPLRGCDGLCVASAFSLAPTVPSYASFSGCTSFSWFPGFSLTQPLHGCARALLCPGLCCAQGFVVPRALLYPGLCCAQGFVVPRALLCPGLCCAQGFVGPRALLCPGLCCAQGFVVPRALLCPGLCCAQGFLVERPFRCTGFLVVKERIADLTATSILSRGVKRLFTVIAHASQATLQGHRGLQPARADLGCRPAEWIT